LTKLPSSQSAGSAVPEKIDVISTSVALRDVRRYGTSPTELPSAREVSARPYSGAESALLREAWTGAEPSFPDSDWISPNWYRRTNDVSSISEGQAEAQRRAKNALFRDEGEYWQILYDGKCIHIRSLKGLFYLRHLLQHPGDKIHVSSLAALGDHYASVAGRAGRSADSGLDVPPEAPLVVNDLGGVIDARATREYRATLDELRSEFEEASQWADFGRTASIQREIEFIEKELASAYGLNGQLRKLDNQSERIRTAVTNCIRDSIRRIAKQNPALGRHLSNAIRTGLLCWYSPENDDSWGFDRGSTATGDCVARLRIA
jgi:hypothetical protein